MKVLNGFKELLVMLLLLFTFCFLPFIAEGIVELPGAIQIGLNIINILIISVILISVVYTTIYFLKNNKKAPINKRRNRNISSTEEEYEFFKEWNSYKRFNKIQKEIGYFNNSYLAEQIKKEMPNASLAEQLVRYGELMNTTSH